MSGSDNTFKFPYFNQTLKENNKTLIDADCLDFQDV